MNAKEFVESLWKKYYDMYEGPLKVVRNKWFEFEVGSPKFMMAFDQTAVIELMGGESFISGVLKYPDVEYHLRTKIARQGFDELRHYEILKDFVRDLGGDVNDGSAAAMRPYFMGYTTKDEMHFLMANVGEKSTDNFFQDLEGYTNNLRLKEICQDINIDEAFHMELLNEKMIGLSEDMKSRPTVEKLFVERWVNESKSIVALARKLGLNMEKILEDSGYSFPPGIL